MTSLCCSRPTMFMAPFATNLSKTLEIMFIRRFGGTSSSLDESDVFTQSDIFSSSSNSSSGSPSSSPVNMVGEKKPAIGKQSAAGVKKIIQLGLPLGLDKV